MLKQVRLPFFQMVINSWRCFFEGMATFEVMSCAGCGDGSGRKG